MNEAYRTFEEGRFAISRTYWDQLIDIEQMNSEFLSRRGYCQFKLGQPELAIADYEAALSVSPEKGEIFSNLATVYFSIGQYDKALNVIDSYINQRVASMLEVNSETLVNKGLILVNLGRNDEACLLFHEAASKGHSPALQQIERHCK